MEINYMHRPGINLHYLMLYNEPVKCRLKRGSGHTGGDMYDRHVRSIRVNASMRKQDLPYKCSGIV